MRFEGRNTLRIAFSAVSVAVSLATLLLTSPSFAQTAKVPAPEGRPIAPIDLNEGETEGRGRVDDPASPPPGQYQPFIVTDPGVTDRREMNDFAIVAIPSGRDDRERVVSTDLTSDSLGPLVHLRASYADGALDGQATGFLVDPGLVVTAAHVLQHPRRGTVSRIAVTPACSANPTQRLRGSSSLSVSRDRFRIPAGWRAPDYPSAADYGAILLDDRRVFAACGTFKLQNISDRQLAESISNRTRDFMIAGFPAEKEYGSVWIGRGSLSSFGRTTVRHYIDTTGGQSGSPVMGTTLDARTGRLVLIPFAIHSRYDEASKSFNIARRIDATVIADLNNWLAELR